MRIELSVESGRRALRQRALKATLRLLLEFLDQPAETLLSVLVCDDERIRCLNRRFRGKDRATDVLAFPPARPGVHPGIFLGDLALSLPTARRQAREYGLTPDEEFIRLLVHGTIHLLGYDHHSPGEARVMEALEARARAHLLLESNFVPLLR